MMIITMNQCQSRLCQLCLPFSIVIIAKTDPDYIPLSSTIMHHMHHGLGFPRSHRSDESSWFLQAARNRMSIVRYERNNERTRLGLGTATTSNPIESLGFKTYPSYSFIGEGLNDIWYHPKLAWGAPAPPVQEKRSHDPGNISSEGVSLEICVETSWGPAKAKPQPKMPSRQEVADLHFSRQQAQQEAVIWRKLWGMAMLRHLFV